MNEETIIRTVKPATAAAWFIIIALSIVGLIYFDQILKPFVLATMIWFIIKVLKTALSKIQIRGKQIPKTLSGILAMVIISGVIFFIYELISVQISQISSQSAIYYQKAVDLYDSFSDNLNNPEIMETFSDRIENFNYGKQLASLVNSLSGFLGDFAVVLIYVIFMLLEESVTPQKIDRLFPGKGHRYQRYMSISEKINSSIKSYFSSKTIISLLTALFSYIILLIFGVDFPAFWAFLIFLLNYIPYIGSFIATFFPSVFAVFQFGDLWYFVYVFTAVQVVQVIMGNVIEPRIMGKTLNLSPLTVLVALALWGSLWGIVGMILSVPLTAMIIIILAQFDSTKFIAVMLSEQGDVD